MRVKRYAKHPQLLASNHRLLYYQNNFNPDAGKASWAVQLVREEDSHWMLR